MKPMRFMSVLIAFFIVVSVSLPGFGTNSTYAAEGACSISTYSQLNFRYRVLFVVDETNGVLDMCAQVIPPSYTIHKCMCTLPGSEMGDCQYDSDTSQNPNPSPVHDTGCEWIDDVASPETCRCSQLVKDCCGSIFDP